MPRDEFDQRWACESCIRGHRATKCTHFDRWMLRVKNAGRPLRDCPHVVAPCNCVEEKFMMIKIPVDTPTGECYCRKATVEDLSRMNIQPDQPSKRQRNRSAPSQTQPYPSVQPTQSPPASANAQYAAIQESHTDNEMSARTRTRATTGDSRAEPSPSVPMQHAMQPQQQPMNQSSMIQTLRSEISQGYHHQEHFNLFSQSQPPATMESGLSPQQIQPASNFLFNPNCQSVQQNGTPFQHHTPNHNPYQLFSNDQNGHNSIASLTSSNRSLVQHRMDPAHPSAINQQMHSDQMLAAYPAFQNFPSIHTPAAVPSGDHEWNTIQECCCGPECNCLWCKTHPTNPATTQRVLDLTEIMDSDKYYDSYWDAHPLNDDTSRLQAKSGDALTNGTHMNSAMDLTILDSATSDQLANINIPKPTFDAGGSLNDSEQFNDFAMPLIKDRDYRTVEYHLNVGGDGNCTNTTGTCLCGENCPCSGCHTHTGHILETPDLSGLSML